MLRSLLEKVRSLRKSPTHQSKTGAEGEDIAVAYLCSQSMRLKERNWKCGIGELDVICIDKGTLVIVEVKSSRYAGNVPPEGRVGKAKRGKLKALAQAYVKARHISLPIRFDVVSVTWEEGEPVVRHIRNAF